MKKIVFRSVIIALILTSAVALIVWYFSMKREVPSHARVIPRDAFAVVTVNLRELTLARSGDEHLYPEMKDQSLMQKELEPFSRAVMANGSTGFEETSDVLFFAYHSGDAAFFGIAVELEDSATFGNLVRVHVSREYNIQPWTTSGIPIVRFDTTSAVIGWTEDAALFLYPIGNHGITTVSQQCIHLLKQTKENSVLMDENFREHELKPFGMAMWIQTKPLLNFTGGGALMEQTFRDVNYFNYFADFEEGEILVRSEWHLSDEAIRTNIAEVPFPCESKDVLGFVRTHLNVKNDSMYEHYADSPPLSNLPLNDDECVELLPYLTGDCISITHDTVSYSEEFITYEYDQAFNRIKKENTREYTVVTRSTSFRVADKVKVNELITAIMSRDSIPSTTRGWVYNDGGLEKRLILSDDLLTVTNDPQVDGRGHPIPEEMIGYMAWFDLQRIFAQKDAGLLSLFIPAMNAAYDELSNNLVTLTNTIPVQLGNVRRSEIVLKFKNEEINGLVQAEEMLRKIYYSK